MKTLSEQNQAQEAAVYDPYEHARPLPEKHSLLGSVTGAIAAAGAAVGTYTYSLTRTFRQNIGNAFFREEGPLAKVFSGERVSRKEKGFILPLRQMWSDFRNSPTYAQIESTHQTNNKNIRDHIKQVSDRDHKVPLRQLKTRFHNWRTRRTDGENLYRIEENRFNKEVANALLEHDPVKINKERFLSSDQKTGIIALSVAAAVVVGYGAKKIIDKLAERKTEKEEVRREMQWRKRMEQQQAALLENPSQGRY